MPGAKPVDEATPPVRPQVSSADSYDTLESRGRRGDRPRGRARGPPGPPRCRGVKSGHKSSGMFCEGTKAVLGCVLCTESLSAEAPSYFPCLVDLNFASPRESSPGRAPWLLRKDGTARGQLDPARVVRFQEHGGGAKKLKYGGFERRPFSTWQTQAPQGRATSAPGLRHHRTVLEDPPV